MLRLSVLLASAALLLAGCGSGARSRGSTDAGSRGSTVAGPRGSTAARRAQPLIAATTTGTRTAPRAGHRRAPKPSTCSSSRLGRLPQTSLLPSSQTAAFRCEMTALWDGIRTGTLKPAIPAFFPEAAYAQLKGIANPQSDWADRLLGEYALDIGAAHALLGANAARARLVDVVVPPAFAHTVPVGVCYNSVGYWETPNSRLVYREDGTLHSFGIASMISWRGAWFVVHLGAILRSGLGGEVDAPSAGAGVAVPSSTC